MQSAYYQYLGIRLHHIHRVLNKNGFLFIHLSAANANHVHVVTCPPRTGPGVELGSEQKEAKNVTQTIFAGGDHQQAARGGSVVEPGQDRQRGCTATGCRSLATNALPLPSSTGLLITLTLSNWSVSHIAFASVPRTQNPEHKNGDEVSTANS